MLPRPHTAGCLACGRENPQGLHLDLLIDAQRGIVRTTFIPGENHIGFTGIAHGGVLATVLDEAMVWAASWPGARFCYCGEMTIRYRKPAVVGVVLTVEASMLSARSRLITTSATMRSPTGELIAESSGKYVPMTTQMDGAIKASLIEEDAVMLSLRHFQKNA